MASITLNKLIENYYECSVEPSFIEASQPVYHDLCMLVHDSYSRSGLALRSREIGSLTGIMIMGAILVHNSDLPENVVRYCGDNLHHDILREWRVDD